MTVVTQGTVNTTALSVPDLIVQIVPPGISYLNGVPSNLVGFVGTAQWGPVNAPFVFGDMPGFNATFGAIQNRKYDMGTAVAAAVLQGANNFVGVRVTDGTDAKATIAIGTAAVGTVTFTGQPTANQTVTIGGTAVTFVASGATGNQVNIGSSLSVTLASLLSFLQASTDTNLVKALYSLSGLVLTVTYATTGTAGNSFTLASTVTGATVSGATLANGAASGGGTFTSLYSGTLANSDQIIFALGSKPGTTKVTVARPGYVPEVFDNIAGSGNTFWTNLATAINTGLTGLRGASQLVTFAAGVGTGAPTPATYTLTGGADGASTITTAIMLGVDGNSRTGMYALRGTKASIAALVDLDDSTSWTTQSAFGLSEGCYMVTTLPAGTTISSAVSIDQSAGLDSYSVKVLHGDWPYLNDTTNGVIRMVSPVGFVAGRLGALSPEQSTLNKPIQGVVQTQRSATGIPYSQAELAQLVTAGYDVIANPCPGGAYFGCRLGVNSSSQQATREDSYTRLTNYIAYTLNTGMGAYVGEPQTPALRANAKATLDDFLQNMQDAGMIEAFKVTCDATNNPSSRVAQGYMQADVQVRYLGIVRYFIVNLQGGQTVTVTQ